MTDKNRSTGVEQCITDITECSICQDVLHDNRCLPCLHTFCLKCLESYRKGKPKGKPLPCPVCRREFSIPKSVSDLPRNFFIDKLIEAHNIKEQNTLPKLCDICSEDTKAVQAERFCSDCRQYLCLSCEKQHKKIKATTSHKTIDSTNVADPPELAPRPICCCVHTTKEAEVYCQDCKLVICWQCKSVSHSSHVSIDISCGAKELATKLEEHIEELSERLRTKQDDIQILTQREKVYTEETDAELANICNEISRLYRKMTDNGDKLKKALNTSTAVHLNEIQALRGKLETTVNELKKHKVYIEQMIHLGNVSDLCEYTDKLISKTAELAEEHTGRIIIPSVAHLSESDLQDLLTGKRTDIHLQYRDRCMDNANRSNDNNIYLQEEVPPTGESKRSFKERRKGIGPANFRPTGRSETRETRETKRYNNLPEDIKERPRSRSVSRSRSRDKVDKYTGKAARCKSADDLAKELSGSGDTTTLKLEVALDDTSDTAVKNPCNHPGIKETTDAETPPDESSLKYEDWSLTRTIRTEDRLPICGITVLDFILYAVFQNSNSIRAYCLTESAFLRTVTVDGLVNPNDIVSCKFNNCLYTCDWDKSRIFRVEIRNKMEQMNWSTGGDLGCLSVTAERNILFAGYKSNKLKEYTSKGELIRLITLEGSFKPWHAIKLVSSDFLICQGHDSSEYHRVCTAGLDGKLQKIFGGAKGSAKHQLFGPYHLAVDKNGCILVNDCNNRRILLLSPSLKFIKEIIPSTANVLRRARRMYLDEVAGRLYVADNANDYGETKDGRILVFSIS